MPEGEEEEQEIKNLFKQIMKENFPNMAKEIRLNGLEQKEEINIQAEQNEETRIQKNEEMLRNLWDNFKPANVKVIGVPEEEEEQEIENLFEKMMNENLPNLAKELDMQVQEAQRVPNKLDPKRTTP